MAQNRHFLETVLRSLSEEEFDKAMVIFQEYYFHNQVVVVDGHNDGGCDIKIYKNSREIKHCIQVTVNKNIEKKLKSDLIKVNQLINDFGYSDKFDFFCSVPISDNLVNEYVKFAKDTYDISLNIYEAKRLAQLKCPELVRYLYSLHEDLVLRPEEMTINKSTQLIYDMLAEGKDSSDIKRGVISSLIITILYEKGKLETDVLKKEVENRIGKRVPSLSEVISMLVNGGRIVFDGQYNNTIDLSDIEKVNVKEIITASRLNEMTFNDEIFDALSDAGAASDDNVSKVVDSIKELYRKAYRGDIDESVTNLSEDWDVFEMNLKEMIPDIKLRNTFISNIKSICENNSIINRIIASESFFGLYKSNKLEKYLSLQTKKIYLDTPTILFFICAKYTEDFLSSWNNPFYKSVLNLVQYQEKHSDKIEFCVVKNYLYEVANEIKKAIHLSWIDESPVAELLGGTSNTLYNYYKFLKANDGFEIGDKIDSLEDFIYYLGIDNDNPDDVSFMTDTLKNLISVLEDLDVKVIDCDSIDGVHEATIEYEKILSYHERDGKFRKSHHAILNDAVQMVYLLSQVESYDDAYLATWDTTIPSFRDALLRVDLKNRYHFARVCNPSMISNRIALSNFNIDQSAITNDVFLYADKTFDISKKIKSLRDLIAPILTKDSCRNGRLLRRLADIRTKQLEYQEFISENETLHSSPFEDVFVKLMPSSKDKQENHSLHKKYVLFMNDVENVDIIVKTVNEALDAIEAKTEFSYEEFHRLVSEYERN